MADLAGFQSENAARAYPLRADNLPGGLPTDFLVDLRVFTAADRSAAVFLARVDYDLAADTYHLSFARAADATVLLAGSLPRLDAAGQSRAGTRLLLSLGAVVGVFTPGAAWNSPTFGGQGSWSLVLGAAQGALEASTLVGAPRGFRRLLLDDEPDDGSSTFGQTLTIRAGYNAALEPSEQAPAAGPVAPTSFNAPRLPSVVLSAGEALGLGFLPGTDRARDVCTLNGVGPDARGDVRLDGRDCLHVSVPTVLVPGGQTALLPHALGLRNDCGPCCGCDQYRRIGRAIERRNAKLQDACNAIRETLLDAVGKYEAIVSALNANRTAAPVTPTS